MAELKNSYSAREVAAMTGLTARQLQWWDTHRLFASHVAPRRTERGGYTERRYTPVDLLELLVLAELRRQGLSVSQLRMLLETLRRQFGVRLFEAIGGFGSGDADDRRPRRVRADRVRRVLQPAQESAAAAADDRSGGRFARAERARSAKPAKKESPGLDRRSEQRT